MLILADLAGKSADPANTMKFIIFFAVKISENSKISHTSDDFYVDPRWSKHKYSATVRFAYKNTKNSKSDEIAHHN